MKSRLGMSNSLYCHMNCTKVLHFLVTKCNLYIIACSIIHVWQHWVYQLQPHCWCGWKTQTLFIIHFIRDDPNYVLFLYSCLLRYWWVFVFILYLMKKCPKTTRLIIGIFKMNIFVWLSYHMIICFVNLWKFYLSYVCTLLEKTFVNQ